MSRPIARFAWAVLAFNLGVIVWGSVVRATGSGAGCGNHWPLCNGQVLPRAPEIETLIEFSHRATSGLALVLVAALAARAFKTTAPGHPARRAALASLALILTEAAVGAGLVLFELVADDRSMARALFMGVHLVNTFFLLAALALTAHLLDGAPAPRLWGAGRRALPLLLALAALLLVGSSGAIAALGDTLFPSRSLAEALAQDLSTTSHVLIRLRVLHPSLAMLFALGLFAITAPLAAEARTPAIGRWARWALGLVVAQSFAGFLNVTLLAPVWLQVVHLLLADLLWISLVLLTASVLAVGERSEAGAAPDAEPAPAAAR
ncbi:MAG: COX15/CtaA family protein [Vicinamibacteria bacterium]